MCKFGELDKPLFYLSIPQYGELAGLAVGSIVLLNVMFARYEPNYNSNLKLNILKNARNTLFNNQSPIEGTHVDHTNLCEIHFQRRLISFTQ